MDDDTKADTDTEDALLKQIKTNIQKSRRHFSEWREEAREDYDFFASEQWSEDDKAKLESEGRPAVVFNRVARTINAVIGLEVQNRQEARYFPREMSDAGVNELLSQAAKFVRDNCDAEDEESEAFFDTLICGMGFTETRLDMEADEESQVLVERRDPFEIGIDHCAKKRNFDDKRFIYRVQKYSKSEFEEQYPDAEVPTSSLFNDEASDKVQHHDAVDQYRRGEEIDNDSRQIEVAQYQYFKLEKFRSVQDADGKITELPEARFNKVKETLDMQGIRYAKEARKKRVYYQCFLTSFEILENKPAPCNQFTFHALTGLRDRNENIWFGLCRLMKDPQRWANKWLSQIQHILNTQAKQGKPIFESGAIKDPRKFKKDWAKPDMPVELNDGALAQNKFMVHQGSGYPDGLDRLLHYALDAINDSCGVNMEMLGLANRDQAGILEESRKKAGVTVLAIFFDSLRRYRKEQGRTLASFIIDYISDGRLIRIAGKEGAQYIPLMKDKLAIKYDVIIADSPTSPNMKEKTWAALSMLLQPIMAAGIPIPPDLLDYTPLPLSLQEKWKKYISEQAQNPEVQKTKQIAEAVQTTDIEVKKSQAELNKAKVAREMAEIQKDPNAENEQAKKDKAAERELTLLDLQIKREEMLNNHQLKRDEASANLQLKRDELSVNQQLKREEVSGNLELKRSDMEIKHEVQKESNALSAKAASKPSSVIQMGSDDAVQGAVTEMTTQLRKSLEASNNNISESLVKGLAVIGKSIAASNEKVAKAISAPKEIIEDKKGRPIGVRTKK